jgi:cytidylate kinase
MRISAIRGATTVNKNEKDEILSKTAALLKEIMQRNSLELNDIISVIFTATKDIDAVYPAVAARELGMTNIPLTCCQEMYVSGSLPMCIRVLMHLQLPDDRILKPVYLEKAVTLRPDITGVTESKLTIAIDGPAGAGKSTIAGLLAKRLGINYLDTGAMYRAVGLKVIEAGGDPAVSSDVIPLLEHTELEIKYENGIQRVYLDGRDVTDKLRTQLISGAASAVAAMPGVRLKLVDVQRDIASKTSLIMDGRDIGTYVLPDANVKIFLTASPEERARRRWLELQQKGINQDYNQVLKDIIERDHNDSSRDFAPLKRAKDAVLIDTTGKTINEVITEIESLVQARRG